MKQQRTIIAAVETLSDEELQSGDWSRCKIPATDTVP